MARARLVMFTLVIMILLLGFWKTAPVTGSKVWATTHWADGHATFYGGQNSEGDMGGACGYGNLYSDGYGSSTAAVSSVLFNNGLSCGACFQLQCKSAESSSCIVGNTITVTATDICLPGSYGGWCDASRIHFHLSFPSFATLAQPNGSAIPVQYRRVACQRQGGVRFLMLGNKYFNYVMIYNVGGEGDVVGLSIQTDTTGWLKMAHSWGQFWTVNANIVGENLSFIATLGNGQSLEFWHVANNDWEFGKTYEATTNFR